MRSRRDLPPPHADRRSPSAVIAAVVASIVASIVAGACDELPEGAGLAFACEDALDCAPGFRCDETAAGRVCVDEDSPIGVVGDAGRDADAGRGEADGGPGDAGPDDAGAGDAGSGDAGSDDAGAGGDAGLMDGGVGDAGFGDAGLSDAGAADAGLFQDAGADPGLLDAGPTDAGPIDAGFVDAGFFLDAGFGDAGPCTGIPTSLTLACAAPDAGATSCEAALADEGACPIGGRAGAIACDATVARATFARAGFDAPDGGPCDLGGWELVAGDTCFDSVTAACANGGGARTCSSDPAVVCVDTDGSTGLTIDANTQLRLQRTFDLTGLADTEVCFRLGETAANDNDGFAVLVDDGATTATVFCAVGDMGVDGQLTPFCAQLPAFVQGDSAATITLLLHSNDSGDRVHLDDVSVRGSPAACPEIVLVDEDFADCDGSSFLGWNVEGSLACVTNFACPDASKRAEVDNATASFDRTLDLTGYEDVRACFFLGEDGTDVQDGLIVEVDTGQGYVPAFDRRGDFGANQECREYCTSLSDADPLVDGHPALGVRLRLFSNGGKIDVDEVRILATARCDAGAALQGFTSFVEGEAGVYATSGQSAVPLDVELVCTDSPSGAAGTASFTLAP